MPWLKIGYFERYARARDWRSIAYVSDSPGRNSPHWHRHHQPAVGDVRPVFSPKYAVGDELLVYASRAGRCPAILEVVGETRWDPDAVDAVSPPDGDIWGMYTPVRLVHAVDLAAAPPLETLGILRASVRRHGHLAIEDWILEDAHIALGAPPRRRRRKPPPRLVPIEAGDADIFDVAMPEGGRKAQRREQRLVQDLAAHLETLGHTVSRNEIRQGDGTAPMYTDLYDQTTQLLVEAKASVRRADVRMAIGQLADYARAVKPKRQAVLLDARPHPDLVALLRVCRIAAIWRTGSGFASTHSELIS